MIKVKQSTNLYLKCFPFFYHSLTKLKSIRNLISRTYLFAELIQVMCVIAAEGIVTNLKSDEIEGIRNQIVYKLFSYLLPLSHKRDVNYKFIMVDYGV